MQKKELVKEISQRLKIGLNESEEIFNSVFGELTDLLAEKHSLTIYGFGTFANKRIESRQGYDISSKQKVILPPKNKITFKSSDSLKEKINDA